MSLKALKKKWNGVLIISGMDAEDPDHRHPGCCARATTGHAAALPSPAMNVRRFMGELQN
jgi:hypothetical protein